jgi:hypothetical protein
MERIELIRARYRLYLSLILLRLYRAGARTRTAVRIAAAVTGTAAAALLLFRRPAAGLAAYLREAGPLLAPAAVYTLRALPGLRRRCAWLQASGGRDRSAPAVVKPPQADIYIPSSGLLQSGSAALHNIFAAGGGEEPPLLTDRRVIRLQAAYIKAHFPRIFGITPGAREVGVLARFGNVDWLYRSLAAAAGIPVGSKGAGGREGRYRAQVAYPTFLRLLRLQLARRRMEGERRGGLRQGGGGEIAAAAGMRERFAGLYPHRITAARLEAARRKAGEQVRARRLAAAAGEELLLLRLHFAAHSLLTRAQLRRQFDINDVFQKLKTIHTHSRRRITV